MRECILGAVFYFSLGKGRKEVRGLGWGMKGGVFASGLGLRWKNGTWLNIVPGAKNRSRLRKYRSKFGRLCSR